MQPAATPAPVPPAAAAKAAKSSQANFAKLQSLRDMGILTDEEFEAAKKRIAAGRT